MLQLITTICNYAHSVVETLSVIDTEITAISFRGNTNSTACTFFLLTLLNLMLINNLDYKVPY